MIEQANRGKRPLSKGGAKRLLDDMESGRRPRRVTCRLRDLSVVMAEMYARNWPNGTPVLRG